MLRPVTVELYTDSIVNDPVPSPGRAGPVFSVKRVMDDATRQRTLEYFERLGLDKVRLYVAVDCERYLGDWQVRELADQWITSKDDEARSRPLWRKLLGRR